MNAFTIKDLENLSGIKAHTIRIWEQRYSFLKPRRSKTNIRYYCNDELKTVLNIALLNKYGYRISHIDKMSEDELKEKIHSLAQFQACQERLVTDMLHHMIDMDMDSFENVLDDFIRQKGIDKTIQFLIFPFLEKVGILWLTNHIHAAQEHLVSNIIRQKLIVGIEGVTSPFAINKTILLFLPEGEHHEIGLLFLQYQLKARGATVLYLGSDVPISDLAFVAFAKKPDYLFSHLTCNPGKFNFEKFMKQLHENLPGIPAIISGQLAQTYTKKIPAGIEFKKSMGEVLEFINRLEKE
jgi:DNA-binding transcriptional MerR regulator